MLRPKKRIFLHVGAQKTGTTSIQQTLYAAREKLLEHDIAWIGRDSWYEGLHGAFCHKEMAKFVPHQMSMDEFLRRRDAVLDTLAQQIKAAKARTVLISSENLNKLWPAELEDMRNFFGKLGEVHVIFLYRHLTKWRASQSQHYAKVGRMTEPVSYNVAAGNLRTIPNRLIEIFGAENTHLVSFEEAVKDGLNNHLLKLLGGPTLEDMGIEEVNANVGISGHATNVSYLLNELFPQGHPMRHPRVVRTVRGLKGHKYRAPPLTKKELQHYEILYEENAMGLKLNIEAPRDLPVSEKEEKAMIPLTVLRPLLQDYAKAVYELTELRKATAEDSEEEDKETVEADS